MFNLYAAEQLGKIRQAEALREAEVERLLKLSQANHRTQPNAIRSLIAGALEVVRGWRARPARAGIAISQSEQRAPC